MRIRDAIFGGLFACLGLFMLYQASGFPSFPGQPYGASLLPSILGAGFVLTGVFLVLRDLLSGQGGTWAAPVEALRTRSGFVAALLVVGTALAHILVSPHVGFIPVSIFCLTALFLWFRVRVVIAVPVALAGTAVCWFFFASVLKVPLPRGILVGIL